MIYPLNKFLYGSHLCKFVFLTKYLIIGLGFLIITVGVALPRDLLIIPDESTGQSQPPSMISETQEPVQTEEKDNPLSNDGLSSGSKKENSDALMERRNTETMLFQQELEEEDLLMRASVQIMDPDTGGEWLASFISNKPLNCPLNQQRQWVETIISAVERNGLPISKEILTLVATIISIESGFRVDPPAVDPSRGEDISSLLERAENELQNKYGKVMSIPPVPQIYRAYKEKYYSKLLECRTEGDIEAIAQNIAEDLMRETAILPKFIRSIILKEIDKVVNIVRTKGSMQLNFPKARQVMKDRGESFTDKELSDYMYTMHGGVDVGVAALKPIFVQYAARYAVPGNLSWLFFVGMDYNYGPFSSRNMMEQIRIRDLSGQKIAIDGDFLHYDDKGRPHAKESETFAATVSIFPSLSKTSLLDAFLLEKDPHYIYTELHQSIAAVHRDRFGETPFAVIGELWMGENAKIKYGTTWKTRSYLNKLDRYLNSVPWDR